MSHALIKLADSSLSKDMAELGLLQPDVRQALEEAQAEAKKQSAKAAAQEIMAVLQAHEKEIEHLVHAIRHARQAEKAAKENIAKLERAKEYGLATTNFVPLAAELGLIGKYDLSENLKHLLVIDESKIPSKNTGDGEDSSGK